MRLHTSTKRARHCLCGCFSQKFFICWWNWTYTTDNAWTSWTYPPTAWHYIAGQDDFHCLSSADRTWKTHYMTTGRDLDSYTLHFTVRPRHETEFTHTRFVQKVSGLTTVHEVDKAYRVLTLIVFNIIPFRSYTLRPTLLPLSEIFCELLFQDV